MHLTVYLNLMPELPNLYVRLWLLLVSASHTHVCMCVYTHPNSLAYTLCTREAVLTYRSCGVCSAPFCLPSHPNVSFLLAAMRAVNEIKSKQREDYSRLTVLGDTLAFEADHP